MKIKLLFVLILCLLVTDTLVAQSTGSNCPAQEPFDWVAIDLFLSGEQHQQTRVENGLSKLNKDESEFKLILAKYLDGDPSTKEEVQLYWQALSDYWQQNDVNLVADSKTCQKINESLRQSNSTNLMNENTVPRAFYHIEGKYLIIHRSTITTTRPQPAVIMGENFSILKTFGI